MAYIPIAIWMPTDLLQAVHKAKDRFGNHICTYWEARPRRWAFAKQPFGHCVNLYPLQSEYSIKEKTMLTGMFIKKTS